MSNRRYLTNQPMAGRIANDPLGDVSLAKSTVSHWNEKKKGFAGDFPGRKNKS